MKSIPASNLVDVLPGVLTAGGNPLSLNAVFLTEDTSIPIGLAQLFADLLSVQNWFGAGSQEAILAGRYFSGFINADALPSALYFYQYNAVAVAAYLRSAPLALSLTQLQALTGSLSVNVDGQPLVAPAAINLASATSPSNAATLLAQGLNATGNLFTGQGSLVTGTPALTITSVTSGALAVGDTVVGTDIPAATTITAIPVGGGPGVYTMSANATATIGPEAITSTSATVVAITYDALRGAFVITSPTTGTTSSVGFATGTLSPALGFTQALGAVQSIGAAVTTPAVAMNGVVNSTQNWVTFMTTFDPDAAGVSTVKLAFAAWVSAVSPAGNERFAYVEWDSNAVETGSGDTTSFGAQVKALGYNGVVPNYEKQNGQVAAFFCGCVASIDFEETDGTLTFAYKSQAGLQYDVTDETTVTNLKASGYNFYGAWATANQQFQGYAPGQMPGQWSWADDYINQVWLNAGIQLSLMELLFSVKKLPYNAKGAGLQRSAVQGPINDALNNGAIQTGVLLSPSQAQQVNNAAGLKIDGILSTVGWYLKIGAPTAVIRQGRTSFPMKLWYTDGGAVQNIQLDSIDVQ